MRYRHVYRLGGLLLVTGVFGCDGDDLITPPSSGSLQITTATTGVEMDADGYTIQVDGGNTQAIGATASIELPDINPGDHTVQLDGLAANCTVAGENPRTVSVAAGETATVAFEVNCGATVGDLQVSTTTTGASPDPDGYSITLAGTDRGAIAPTGTVTLEALPAGDHSVGLSGIAANCTVGEANPQTVTVVAGASATVSFTVSCAAAPTSAGSIRITTATSGEPDPDGYSVTLDGGAAQPIGTSSTVTLTNVAVGSHSVGLSGLSGNCTLQGSNPRPVTVAAGTTAEVSFAISCSATTGSIEVRTTTTGSEPDPDGYSVSMDGGAAQPIDVSSSVTLTNVAAGSHSVGLSGLAENCTLQGSNPRPVTVAAGTTAEVSFAISCSATTGSIEVRTTTTGSNPDPDGYSVSLDDGAPQPIDTDATLSLTGISAGAHRVELSGLAANCSVQNDNPQQVSVAAGGTERVEFTISCPAPSGSSWTRMNSGTTMSVVSVYGSSATNVFATAQSRTPGCGSSCFEMGILHYDGSRWSTQFTHEGIVWDVWAAPTGEAFVLVTPGSFPGPVLQYDGQQWSSPAAQPPPSPFEGNPLELRGIWGTSSTDVFAVGSMMDDVDREHAYIAHYDGSRWSTMEVASGGDVALLDVWGSSATDVYAVGASSSDNRAVILHYDGRTWSEVLREPDLGLVAIWGSSANDVYAVGATRAGNGAVWHYNGTSWSALPMVPRAGGLRAIWGSSSRDIYAVGGLVSPRDELWHFDGTTWREETETNGTDLFDVWGSSANDVFVVGAEGTILHGP